jgi:hypothetical protein
LRANATSPTARHFARHRVRKGAKIGATLPSPKRPPRAFPLCVSEHRTEPPFIGHPNDVLRKDDFGPANSSRLRFYFFPISRVDGSTIYEPIPSVRLISMYLFQRSDDIHHRPGYRASSRSAGGYEP